MTSLKRMYRSIVVGTDGSASARVAVNRAVALARAGTDPVTVHLVSAYQPLNREQVAYLRDAVPEQFKDEVREDMGPRTALDEAAAVLAGAGLTHTTHAPLGAPTEAILAVVAEVGADLVIVGSRGLSAGSRLIMGSVSASLAHDAPVDVLIARTGPDHEEETVTSALGRLGEAANRFGAGHPDLTRTVNDVSYYLSGLGI